MTVLDWRLGMVAAAEAALVAEDDARRLAALPH